MTPEQVREMPNRDCILLIEGMKPVYDRKNRPFSTAFWKEAEAAAGKNGYTHPVRILHDKERDVYKIDMDQEEFLYLNWDEQQPLSLEELQQMVKDSKKTDVSSMEEPEDVRKAENSQPDPVSVDWDLSGSLVECLKRYAGSFSNEKREFLLQCLEEGLSERQIKRMLPLRTMEEMKLYRRIFLRRSS